MIISISSFELTFIFRTSKFLEHDPFDTTTRYIHFNWSSCCFSESFSTYCKSKNEKINQVARKIKQKIPIEKIMA